MNTTYMQNTSLTEAKNQLRNLLGHTATLLELEKKLDVKNKTRPNREWSVQEELGHLLDSALNNIQRFMRLQIPVHLTSGQLHAPGYDQNEWVRVAKHNQRDWLELVNLWNALNSHILFLMANVDQASLNNIWLAGQESLSLEWLFIDYVGHTEHHLKNILGNV